MKPARPALAGVSFSLPARSDDAGGEDGQGVVFEQVDLQAVVEREGLGHGKVEGDGGAWRRWRSCASSAAARSRRCRDAVSLASASVLSGLRGTSSTTFLPGTQSTTTL